MNFTPGFYLDLKFFIVDTFLLILLLHYLLKYTRQPLLNYRYFFLLYEMVLWGAPNYTLILLPILMIWIWSNRNHP